MVTPLFPHIFFIGLGGALGAVMRYLFTNIISQSLESENSILWGTFGVNAIGSFLIGLSAAYFFKQGGDAQSFKMLLNIGILGGFTTFSTFSFENVELIQSGQFFTACIYIFASVLISISLCLLSFLIGKSIF